MSAKVEVVKMGSAFRIVRETEQQENGAKFMSLVPVSDKRYETREEAEADARP